MKTSRLTASALTTAAAFVIHGPSTATASSVTGNQARGWCTGVVRPGPQDGILEELAGGPVAGTDAGGTPVVTERLRLTPAASWRPAPDRRVHVAECAVEVPPGSTPATLAGLRSRYSTAFDLRGPVPSVEISLVVPAGVRVCGEAKMNAGGHDLRSNILCTGPVAASDRPPPPAPATGPAPARASGPGTGAVVPPRSGRDEAPPAVPPASPAVPAAGAGVPFAAGLVLTSAGMCAIAAGRGPRRRRAR